MRKTIIGCFIVLTVAEVSAAGIGLKAGLWQTRVVKQIRDGQDTTSQITQAMERMRESMARMTPEQREKMQTMMKDHGSFPTAGADGTVQMCISPEMAREDTPIIDREGCPPPTIHRSGNHASFELSCTSNGLTTTGKGESTTTGDVITTVLDMTSNRSGESHVTHVETEMKFLGADCGDVKPMAVPKTPP